eukprot:gene5807-9630_t
MKVVKDRNLRVALIGRPNVGKSTIYNKIIGRQYAITDNTEGTTVDCQEDETEFYNMKLTVIDTPVLGAENIHHILKQTEEVLKSVHVALIVTSAKSGLTDWDNQIAKYVLRKDIPTLHILNKCDFLPDNEEEEENLRENNFLGIGNPIFFSGERNFGFKQLQTAIRPLFLLNQLKNRKLPSQHILDSHNDEDKEKIELDEIMRLSIVGRTNVGKSTLFNNLIGTDRVVVSDVPGTTRDTIQLKCLFEGKSILLADTAGLRKKKYIDNRIEKSSLKDTKKTIDYSNTVILVVDAQMPLTHEDLQIASMVEKEGRSLIIAANKWDLITNPFEIADKIEHKITTSLSQIKGVSVVVTSALTGKNLELLLKKSIETYERWDSRISTGRLNRFFQKFLDSQQFTSQAEAKIQYISQIEKRPPKFALFFSKAPKKNFNYMEYHLELFKEENKKK